MVFFGGQVGALILLRRRVEELVDSTPLLLGYVPSSDGSEMILNRTARSQPVLWSLALRAAESINLAVSGVQMAVGAQRLPACTRLEAAGLLMAWPRGCPSRYEFREMRPHWGTNLDRVLGVDPADYAALFWSS